MTREKEAIIREIAWEIKAKYRPQKIILFGSYARGDADEDSDVDLLIIKETRKPFRKRWAEICQMVSELRRGMGFSPFVVTPSELKKRLSMKDPFFEGILKEGVVLYAA